MKILFALLILAPISAFATHSRVVTLSGGATLPATYSTSSAQSLVLSEMYDSSDRNLRISATINNVACKAAKTDQVAPTQPNGSQTDMEIYPLASESAVLLNYGTVRNIFCRSTAGTLSAGTIIVTTW